MVKVGYMDFEISGKKCLVTGASGFVGQNVSLRLMKEKAIVRALVRNRAKATFLEKSGAEIFSGDMTDQASLQKAIQGCEVVFHFAGVLNDFKPWSYYYKVNTEGTKILAEAALKAGVQRFIHTSTAWVYGMLAGQKITESSPHLKSGDPYCDTKLEAEDIVRQLFEKRGLPCVVIQPSAVYGPNDLTWTGRPLQLIRSGKMILVNGGRGLIQPIFIDDLVDGIIAAARQGRLGQSYILCGNEVVTFKEFFEHFSGMLNKKSISSVPGWAAMTMAALLELISRLTNRPPLLTRKEIRSVMVMATYDGTKASRELGFQPRVDLAQGMAKVNDWLKSR
jgi:nucleoside-diphosphate-sugar epimerase